MDSLERLYHILGGPDICKYSKREAIVISNDHMIVELTASEVLELSAPDLSESITIAAFEDEPTLIRYGGVEASSMLQTVEKMRMPYGWSDNLGERVFMRFRDILKRVDGDVTLDQKIVRNFQQQLKVPLAKLAHIYRGGEIDSEFYSNMPNYHTLPALTASSR